MSRHYSALIGRPENRKEVPERPTRSHFNTAVRELDGTREEIRRTRRKLDQLQQKEARQTYAVQEIVENMPGREEYPQSVSTELSVGVPLSDSDDTLVVVVHADSWEAQESDERVSIDVLQ